MHEAMGAVRAKELDRGVCLVGPHRDDLVLHVGGLPAKGYASHGEAWSVAVALRLASYRLLSEPGDDHAPWGDWGPDARPALILDDVFAELDVRRRDALAEVAAQAGQVIITAADGQDVPCRLAQARFDVGQGAVRRVA